MKNMPRASKYRCCQEKAVGRKSTTAIMCGITGRRKAISKNSGDISGLREMLVIERNDARRRSDA